MGQIHEGYREPTFLVRIFYALAWVQFQSHVIYAINPIAPLQRLQQLHLHLGHFHFASSSSIRGSSVWFNLLRRDLVIASILRKVPIDRWIY